jgi:hypothetical protein
MRKGSYTVRIKDDGIAEKIFDEIDSLMIALEHKYPCLQVSIP